MNLFEPLPDGKWHRRFSGELGAELWGGSLYELAPGQESAYHWQVGEEEWLLVLAGAVTLRTPEGEHALRPWDLVAFPRGESGAHQVRNETDEPVRLVFFSTLSDPEIVVYPDDGTVKAVGGWKDGKEAIRGFLERPA
ncbi:MAG TPA: cupin domain-containing protein [Gaiellaceae bacterium]